MGSPGWDSQSEALSESEELEEGEVGGGEPVGMRVRNWAAEFFFERNVFEGVPRRERLWRARAKGCRGPNRPQLGRMQYTNHWQRVFSVVHPVANVISWPRVDENCLSAHISNWGAIFWTAGHS